MLRGANRHGHPVLSALPTLLHRNLAPLRGQKEEVLTLAPVPNPAAPDRSEPRVFERQTGHARRRATRFDRGAIFASDGGLIGVGPALNLGENEQRRDRVLKLHYFS
jgi:hypothetical protein